MSGPKDFDGIVKELGHTINLAGVVYGGSDRLYLALFPDEEGTHSRPLQELEGLTTEEWTRMIKQTDLLEVEVIGQDENNKWRKITIRKSARNIEINVRWEVYRRDEFACRYCGRKDGPMTLDHLVLWEDGGPTIEQNLVTSCPKCNKKRGRTQYPEWLESAYYRKVSKNLHPDWQARNQEILAILPSIPRRMHKRGR
jgi:hypothetical protein